MITATLKNETVPSDYQDRGAHAPVHFLLTVDSVPGQQGLVFNLKVLQYKHTDTGEVYTMLL